MEYGILKKTIKTIDKYSLDFGSRACGFGIMYGLGGLVGERMDHIPYINELIPQAVNYVFGIDVKGNLDGLVRLVGEIYGVLKSGVRTYGEPIEVVITPGINIDFRALPKFLTH